MRTTCLLVLLLLATGPAQAEEGTSSSKSAAERATTFAGSLGLTGMRNMVGARVPAGTWSARGGLRYDVLARRIRFNGAIDTSRQLERHELSLYGSASLFGLAEVSLRVPYVWESEDNNRKGLLDLTDDTDAGWANVEGAAKVSLGVGPIVLAPYASGTFPTAEPALRELLELEYGVAATMTFLNHYGAVHANVAGFYVEEGLHGLRLRVGASFVVLATRPLLVRVFAYAEGIEWEGSADADLQAEGGAQVLLFEFLTVTASASYRILDANLIDDTLRKELNNVEGVFDRHYEDKGTFAFQLDVGVAF